MYDLDNTYIVANIATRDALAGKVKLVGKQVTVLDASDDPELKDAPFFSKEAYYL